MKPNIIFILVGFVAVLGLGFFVIQGDRPQVISLRDSNDKLVKELDTVKVKSIDIKRGDVAVRLDKKETGWIMASHKNRPAKNDRIGSLLSSVRDAEKEGIRPSTNDALFDLDAKNRTEVLIGTESGEIKLFVGKSPDMGKAFVRTEPTGPIYEIDKALDTDAGLRAEGKDRVLDPTYFYDLQVLNLNSDDVIDVSIKTDKSEKATRVQKVLGEKKEPVQPKQELKPEDKPVWMLTEPEKADADESNVSSIVSNLTKFAAKGYADMVPEKDRGLDKPSAVVTLKFKDGTEQKFTFGKVDADEVILTVDGKPEPYKVYKYQYENVIKDLKKKEEAKPDASSAAPGTPPAPGAPAIPGLPAAPAPATSTPAAPKADPEKKPEAVPAIPSKVEPEAKPVLPPAVVKPEEQKKVEEKK
ncbi:MAG TPA: DUF4340 domain-containing protein [Planctomycetota bacterium]|nr:DUF4340 domain-containing protein [Planctomycetota bacterium]